VHSVRANTNGRKNLLAAVDEERKECEARERRFLHSSCVHTTFTMAQSNWEADKMLDVYIYDYLVKRNLQLSAKAFLNEGKVSSDPVGMFHPPLYGCMLNFLAMALH
jgi:hypothetical protein